MSGRCEVCGCTDEQACPGGCIWANASATLCSRCAQDDRTPTLVSLPLARKVQLCEACEQGDHEHCGMQVCCECDHVDDGTAWTGEPMTFEPVRFM